MGGGDLVTLRRKGDYLKKKKRKRWRIGETEQEDKQGKSGRGKNRHTLKLM